MTVEDLSVRLEKVERANRRLRAGGVAAIVLAAAITAMGQAAPAAMVVREESFEGVGSDEEVRSVFDPSGLILGDAKGKVRAAVSLDEDGALTPFHSGQRQLRLVT